MVGLVLAYYVLLRSILGSQSELRRCLTRCRHCRIFFFTHPRNAGRWDLGCPFGCREAHRKEQSSRRSTAYYQDPAGKGKKRDLNARRRRPAPEPPEPGPKPAVESGPGWPRPMVEYLAMVVGLIERRRVRVAEVLAMLARAVRQHSMVRRRRLDQALAGLYERPP